MSSVDGRWEASSVVPRPKVRGLGDPCKRLVVSLPDATPGGHELSGEHGSEPLDVLSTRGALRVVCINSPARGTGNLSLPAIGLRRSLGSRSSRRARRVTVTAPAQPAMTVGCSVPLDDEQ